jgi:hypothetical protein
VLILWWLYVIVAPPTLLVYWGVTLVWLDVFSTYVAVGIPTMALMAICVGLAFADWYGHKWYMTQFTKAMLAIAPVSCLVFCIAVTFSGGTFDYNGSSALLLGVNFMFAVNLIYLRSDA